MKETRNNVVDAIKGLAIILMVVGHCGCPTLMHNYIYLFHMPLFFFISGYLFKISYADSPLMFIKRRLSSCYVPFLKYGTLFLLFHVLLTPLGFSEQYTLNDYLRQCFMIVSLSGTEVFLGSYWFLIEMLFSSIIFIYLLQIVKKSKNQKYDTINCAMGGVILLSLICAYIISVMPFHIPKISVRTFLAVIYMSLGVLYRNYGKECRLIWSVIFLIIPLIILTLVPYHIGSSQDNGMNVDNVIDGVIYVICSLFGIFGTIGIIQHFSVRFSLSMLSYMGRNSMGILTWHLLAMALVLNLMYLMFSQDLPPFKFPFHVSSYWLLFSIFAIAISIMFIKTEHLIIGSFKNFIS